MKTLINLKLLLFLLLSSNLFAQSTQNIKGIITDKQSEMPLIGATIIIQDTDPILGSTTDINGHFMIENVPLGRYTIQASYLGYESTSIPNIELNAGKENYLEISLEESFTKLNEVVVKDRRDKSKAQNELATISARSVDVEEINRYSGGRGDVGRIAANFAGVSTADDARNDIVIRGNSPTGVLWRLEGIPIPNPNHFAFLGTTGGPVSALNTNLLKNSDFLTSAFPAEYGNALSGVFDLGFRKGNRDKHEFTFQLGAVSGIELMAEGPLNKAKGGSYLVAGRYSFVDIAANMGMPIGTDASPNYQDLAFHLDFGKTKLGRFSIFGVNGWSQIDLTHDKITENDLYGKVDEDNFPRSLFGVIGLKHNLLLGKKSYWRTIIAGSTSQSTTEVDKYFNMDTEEEYKKRTIEIYNSEYRLSLSSFINKKFNSRLTLRTGLLLEENIYDLTRRNRLLTSDWVNMYDFKENTFLGQAYVQSQFKLRRNLTLNTGLHAQLFSLNNEFLVEPRLALNYALNDQNTFNMGYGLHSQSAPLAILLTEEEVAEGMTERSNINLEAIKSHHFVVGYDVQFHTSWRAKVEAYYQYVHNVPVDPYPSSFSTLNIGASFIFPEDKTNLVNQGSGQNYGLEFTLEKFFSKGYYGLLTSTLYNSQYKGSDNIQRNTAFNNQYVINLLAGKEFKIGLARRNAITFDTKLTTAGGRFYTPIDLEASREVGFEILKEEQAYSQRHPNYFRWDAKLGIKLNSKKRALSHQFYIDIQNITNQQNLFIQQYNRASEQIYSINQLGFFPDFMYRIQF